jgi:uroporphyrinogen decarboxylase
MTKRDFVISALKHRESTPIPYYLNYTSKIEVKLKQYYQIEDVDKFLGNYIYWTSVVKNIPENVVNGKYVDIFGVRWENVGTTRGMPIVHPLTEASLEGYKFPEPLPQKRFDELGNELSKKQDLFKLVKIGDFYERANFLRGMKNLMIDMYKHPRFVNNLLDEILEYNLSVVNRLQYLEVDGLWLSDDYGYQNGLLISPKLWRHFIKPRLKTLVDRVKNLGFYAFLHSDGDIKEIIPDLIEVKFDAIHPVQPEVIELEWLKTKFGDRLSFFGCFSTQELLPHEPPEIIRDVVQKTMIKMGRGGGFIIAPGIGLLDDTPTENAVAFIDEVMNNKGIKY